MNADQAFDNLMTRKALAIPIARAEAEPPVSGVSALATPRISAEPTTIRVSDILDGEPADYMPRGGAAADSQRAAYYNNPTETDLEPIGDGSRADDFARAELQGAKILGRDAASPPPEATARDDSARIDPRLAGARRLRRFAYIPLAGMEAFEASAREMSVALASLTPNRPSLVMTSAVRREGRTELAVRIALALAKRVGFRVLLADFDVRNPQIAGRLGLSSNRFTLTDVLRGGCSLGDALTTSDEDDLYVLVSRSSDRDGDEALDVRQVEVLFDEFHRLFDFVVIDSGPVDRPETMILSRLAGATALAGFCGRSSIAAMRTAESRITAAGGRFAGVALAGA